MAKPLTEISQRRLETCDKKLQTIMRAVNEVYPIYILCGHRNARDQNDAYKNGNSRLKWPDSRHNKMPSEAVDFGPKPLDWRDIEAFRRRGNLAKAIASEIGVKVIYGGDWKTLKDYGHLELV